MGRWSKWCAGVAIVWLLAGCGGVEDREGRELEIGKQYVMTEEGLQLVAYLVDKDGQIVEPGKIYRMTRSGLENIPYLKDTRGRPLEPGFEYVVTPKGMRFLKARHISGALVDAGGRAVPGTEVAIAGTEYRAAVGSDGSFVLPFVEGYVKLSFAVPGLPPWCRDDGVENTLVTLATYPNGWDLGAVKLPCLFEDVRTGRHGWATPDGRYVDNRDGTVTDFEHGLMWEAEPGERSVSWTQADSYVRGLDLGTHVDWRLPTREELMLLSVDRVACGWQEPTLIRGVSALWTAERSDDESAYVFNVCTGKARLSRGFDEGAGINPGVLAVRRVP